MYNYDKAVLDGRIFNFIYGCALHDAVLQKAFKGERKWIEEITEAKEFVKEYINDVISGNLIDESKHERKFLETAQNVCRAVNSKKPDSVGLFSFGNAQKLINMVAKHVYAHTYSIHLACNGSMSIRENFRYCHCPMDSIMLEKIEKAAKDNKIELVSNFRKSWGSEDFEKDEDGKVKIPSRYVSFQKAIKEIIQANNGDIFSIEYDYVEWKK